MFRIKICGITRAADAVAAIDAGADAIGLNFFRGSPRCVDAAAARAIRDAAADRALVVGVFVNHAADEIAAIADSLRLDLLQLSGDEPPELIAQLGRRPVMRALRASPDSAAAPREYLEACRALGCAPRLVLWDTFAAGSFGGTGRVADWSAAAAFARVAGAPPLILAGGLRPQNVADAIRAVHPRGVDTASGVESSPGIKDPERMAEFVAAAQRAFDNLAVAD